MVQVKGGRMMTNLDNGSSIYQKFSAIKPAEAKMRAETREKPKKTSKEKLLMYTQQNKSPVASPRNSSGRPEKVTVHIAGMQYRLFTKGENDEGYIRFISDRADQMIHQLQKSMPGTSMMNISVLALVNAMDEINQLQEKYVSLQDEMQQLLDSLDADKADFAELREINWELKKEVLRLSSQLSTVTRAESEDNQEEPLLPLEELIMDASEEIDYE